MSHPRVPPIPPSELREDQRHAHDMTYSFGTSSYKDSFTWKDSHSALLGPFPPILRTPAVMDSWMETAKAFATLNVPATAREIAILVVGVKNQAAYAIYSHEQIAVQTTDLTQDQANEMKKGRKPEGLDEKGGVAYDLASELVGKVGPLKGQVWERAVGVFGEEVTLGLVQFIGFYSWVSVLMNAADVPAPGHDAWEG